MRYSLPAHTLRAIADIESKQTAPEPSPRRPRGNGPITLHTVCGWDEMEWDYAMRLPWWYFWAWLNAHCQWPGPEQMPLEIRGHCVCVRVSVPTHVSLASLAPRPKSLLPTVSSGILPSIASRPHTRTHAQGPNTHMLWTYCTYTNGHGWQWQNPTVHYAYMHDLCGIYSMYGSEGCAVHTGF